MIEISQKLQLFDFTEISFEICLHFNVNLQTIDATEASLFVRKKTKARSFQF